MENKMMVMRRALRDVSRVAEEMTRGMMTGEPVDRKTVDSWAARLCEIISRDLSIPLRQCDVGTAEEQEARMIRWCGQHKCEECQFFCVANDGVSCEFTWSQSPYKADEKGNNDEQK